MTAREWTIALPWTKPPLSLNDKGGTTKAARFAKGRLIADVRGTARMLARHHRVPRLERWTATLHYQPADNRRRDAMNLYATVKPLVDGFVDAGVAVGDDTRWFVDTPPVIHPTKGRPGRLWVVVADLSHLPGTQGALPVVSPP